MKGIMFLITKQNLTFEIKPFSTFSRGGFKFALNLSVIA